MHRPTPPRRGPFSVNPITNTTHTLHSPEDPNASKLTPHWATRRTYSLRVFHIPLHRAGPGVTGAGQATGTQRPRPHKPVAEDTEAQTAPQLAQHITAGLTLHDRERHKLNLIRSSYCTTLRSAGKSLGQRERSQFRLRDVGQVRLRFQLTHTEGQP